MQIRKSQRVSCVNNLKEIGTAYRLWAGDNGDLVPPQQSVSKGGWKDFLTNANQGAICWTNYAIMADELGPISETRRMPKRTNGRPWQVSPTTSITPTSLTLSV